MERLSRIDRFFFFWGVCKVEIFIWFPDMYVVLIDKNIRVMIIWFLGFYFILLFF